MGILVTQYKSRAPGGETFPQFMLARFGKRVHLLFCCLTIVNNVSIISDVVDTGCKIYSAISTDVTFELAWIITVITAYICATVGTVKRLIPLSYTMFIYLQLVTVVLAVKVFIFDPSNTIGSFNKIYDAAVRADSNITEASAGHLTMRSYLATKVGISRLLVQTSEVVFDQSMWDTYACFVPGEEGWGTLLAVLIWCPFPLVFGMSFGFGSLLVQTSTNSTSLETTSMVNVAKSVMGIDGLFVLFSLYAFTVTTRTTLKTLSITKMLTMDFYAVHLRPFRVCYDVNCCTFCGKSKDDQARPNDACQCSDPVECIRCQEDMEAEKAGHQDYKISCPMHSLYLKYNKALGNIHRTSVLLVLCTIVPMGFIINYFEVFGLIFNEIPKNCNIGALGSFILALYWEKLTEPAVFIGTLTSSLLAVLIWTILYLLNSHTSFKADEDVIDVCACGVGLVSGFILPVLITFLSLLSKSHVDDRKPELTWQRTLDLGNPFEPWTRIYSQVFQLPLSTIGHISSEDVMKAMRPVRFSAYLGHGVYLGIIMSLLGLGCIPAVFTLTDFKAWVSFLFVWLLLSTLAALTLPIISHFVMMKRCKISFKMSSLPHFVPPKICIETESQ
nr:urea active transporter protein [Hymenolepis microstoma]